MEGSDELSARREAKTLDAPKPDGEPEITMHMDDDRIVFRDEATLKDYVDAATVAVQNRVTELSSKLSLLRDGITALADEWERDRDVCLAWIADESMHTDADHPRRLSDLADRLNRSAESLRALTERERWEDFHAQGERPMNRDECQHDFTTVPEWGDEQAIPCSHNCGVRAIIRLDGKTTAHIEADLRERLAGEIEAMQASEVGVWSEPANYTRAKTDAARIVRGATTEGPTE